MDNTHDLRVLLGSRHPLLFMATREEDRLLGLIRVVARDSAVPVWVWSSTVGLARDGAEPQYLTTDLRSALDFIGDLSAPGVFVLSDAEPALHDPTTLRRLKEAAQAADAGQTLIVTGVEPEIPSELADLAHAWTLRPPDRWELQDLAARTLGDFAARGFRVDITRRHFDQLASSLAGMTMREAERAIQRAILEDGAFTPDDLAVIRSLKAELLNQEGILELIEADAGTLDDVGGLDGLKDWLALRGAIFRGQGAATGLEPPRGLLLTGVPGCGKSLVAKTLARTWGLPLVLLDPARLYGKYVGESEQRLHSALGTIDAMSPAVVWIDEIEKGFATGEDGGVSRRILGTFLRWLQDRTSQVFVVATANDVSSLPPELLRKGRLDETFFVDLPDARARRSIFAIHLDARGHDSNGFDLDRLAAASEGFSGAEIETAVVGALYRAFGDDARLTDEMIDAELGATIPLSVSRREEVAALRSWAAERALAA